MYLSTAFIFSLDLHFARLNKLLYLNLLKGLSFPNDPPSSFLQTFQFQFILPVCGCSRSFRKVIPSEPGLSSLHWKALLESGVWISNANSLHPAQAGKLLQIAKQWSKMLGLTFGAKQKACQAVNLLGAPSPYLFLFLAKCHSNIVLNSWTSRSLWSGLLLTGKFSLRHKQTLSR